MSTESLWGRKVDGSRIQRSNGSPGNSVDPPPPEIVTKDKTSHSTYTLTRVPYSPFSGPKPQTVWTRSQDRDGVLSTHWNPCKELEKLLSLTSVRGPVYDNGCSLVRGVGKREWLRARPDPRPLGVYSLSLGRGGIPRGPVTPSPRLGHTPPTVPIRVPVPHVDPEPVFVDTPNIPRQMPYVGHLGSGCHLRVICQEKVRVRRG